MVTSRIITREVRGLSRDLDIFRIGESALERIIRTNAQRVVRKVSTDYSL